MQTEADGRAPYLHMLWGSLAFAGMGAFGHLAGESCSWQWVAVARTSVAFVIAFIVAKLCGVRLVFWKPGTLWIRSLAGSAGLLGNFYALTHLPISDALTLSNTSPIFVTLLLWLVFGQKPNTSTLMAVLLGVGGIVLIQQPHFQSGWFACLMALGGALGTSIAMLGLNRLQSVDPRAVVTHFSGVSSVTTMIFLLATGVLAQGTPPAGVKESGFLLMTGVSGVLGQFGMTLAFSKGHAARVSVVILSQILFAFILDLVIWHRAINAVSVIGMMLVAAPTGWLILHDASKRTQLLPEAEA